LAEARNTCRHLLDVAMLAGNATCKGLAHRLSALIHHYQDNPMQAAADAEQAIAVWNKEGSPTLQSMQARQLLALAWIQLGKYSPSKLLLDQAMSYFKQAANPLAITETYLILALWAHASGRLPESRDYLQKGLSIASTKRFGCMPLLRRTDIALIGHLTEQFRLQLPESFCPHTRMDKLDVCVQAAIVDTMRPDDNLSTPEETIALEIRTFGGFSVMRNGNVPIEEREWCGHRPKLLLKAILVHGLREIPKDILIDDLWPESTPEAGLQNFKVTLHRLRKILEPELKKSHGSVFIHLKNNLVSLAKDACRVDLEAFLQACKDIKRHALNGETVEIIALSRKVMALYQGDFLPEEPYAPWVEMKRWALKDTYLGVVLQLARIFYSQEHYEQSVDCCRTVLQVDPCHETAGQILIQACIRQGRGNEALQAYQTLCKALHEELGVTPDPATTHLVEKIKTVH